ncbi:MAG: spermidine synthase [Lachnospiraceae bacterium]|nr:spermidine synthase [Lachnospiraceae bacterium]
MAVELGASRLLAPYFSSSQIVWTIIIGTIMIAMALGNIYGGKSADKDPNPDKLYFRIVIAAVWIALIPVIGKLIIIFISGILIFTVSNNFLIIAAFISCMIVFVFPLFLLGTVTPSLVKYSVDSLDDSGKTVGYLNASNTIGSIIGTFIPTFVSIPTVGTSITFLIFSGILLVLSLVYFKSANYHILKSKKLPIAMIIFILCTILGHNDSFAFWNDNLTYEGESVYNYLQVAEDDSDVILSTNVLFGVQSVYKKEPGLTGMYYDYAMASLFMTGIKDISDSEVLILGMGTGTFATQCNRYFENIKCEGVEIDQKITNLAHKYFHLSKDINVTTYDGRAFLNACDKKYDVIMVDAYQDITIPFQMSSKEFFKMVKDHLKPNGVMVVNMNMRGSDNVEGSINDYLSDTISSVFKEVYTVDVDYCTNRELFASDNKDMISIFNETTESQDNYELKTLMTDIGETLNKHTPGKLILTDDKAPVELLGMKEIDLLIKEEVDYYKSIYKEKGLKGLMEEVL